MATLYINIGLSERMRSYIRATYPQTTQLESSDNYVRYDTGTMTTTQINNMIADIKNRIVESVA